MTQPNLFEVGESLSPELAWMRKHGVNYTYHAESAKLDYPPHLAWLPSEGARAHPENDLASYRETFEETNNVFEGFTKTEALVGLAKKCGLPGWLEERYAG